MAESDDDQRLLDLIQLAMVPGVGPHTSQALLERFGSAGRALEASRRRTAERRRRRPQDRRKDLSRPSGLRRRRRAGVVPAHGRQCHFAWRSRLSAAAREHTRPAQPALRERGHSSRATSSPSRWSARGTVRPTACGSPNGYPPRWPERVSRSSRGWLAASTRPPTVVRSRREGEPSPSSPTDWRRSTLPSTKSWPAPSPKRGPWSARCRWGKVRWPACSRNGTGSFPGCRWVCWSSKQPRAAGRSRPRRTPWNRIARSSPYPARPTAWPAGAAIA